MTEAELAEIESFGKRLKQKEIGISIRMFINKAKSLVAEVRRLRKAISEIEEAIEDHDGCTDANECECPHRINGIVTAALAEPPEGGKG